MFLTLMLVGYAASKVTGNDRKAGASWRQRWFSPRLRSHEAAPPPPPSVGEDSTWTLGAEAWVALPPEVPPR